MVGTKIRVRHLTEDETMSDVPLDRSTQTFARCLRRTITRETASWASACRADGEEVAAGRAEDLEARLTAELDRWLQVEGAVSAAQRKSGS